MSSIIFLLDLINWPIIINVLSSISGIAVVVVAVINMRENQRLKLASEKAFLIFYLTVDYQGLVLLCIENIGSGPAFDVELKIKKPENVLEYDFGSFGFERISEKISLIRANDKRVFILGQGYNLCQTIEEYKEEKRLEKKRREERKFYFTKRHYASTPLSSFSIWAEYKNIKNKKCKSEEKKLSIEEFLSVPGLLEKPTNIRIAESLESFQKEFEIFRKDVTTIKDRERKFYSINPIYSFKGLKNLVKNNKNKKSFHTFTNRFKK